MLDGGPARIPKGNDRRSAYRRESAYSSSEDNFETRQESRPTPSPTPVEPRSTQSYSSDGKNGFPKWLAVAIVAVLTLALLIAGVMFALSSAKNSKTGIDESKHQAVFFSTGQVYFGKLEVVNDKYMRLTDVFYIQSNPGDDESTAEAPETESANSGSMQLVKLGEEVHAPEDEIMINREHVLFYENIRPEGRVSQLIKDYKSGSN